jgi:NADP-dependent 3-hydroxy acid dehydrogenase YdfG/acyl carrier protein
MIWGFVRALSAEYPSLRTGLIDLPKDIEDMDAQRFLDVVMTQSTDTEFALRKDRLFVQRIVRDIPQAEAPRRIDGTALITGGLGGLGLQIAEWLALHGTPRLVLVGRRGQDTPNIRDRIAAIAAQGTEVTIAKADVSDRKAMARILSEIAGSGVPLKAVFHAAGVLDDALLINQNPARFMKVLDVKVNGARVLHELTQHLELDHFVLFSSIAAVLGNAGQSSYCAANAFLDALAHYRRAKGLAALSINWGPWQGEGMADDRVLDALKGSAVTALRPEEALAALAGVLGGGAQVLVADIDWSRLRESHERIAARWPLDSQGARTDEQPQALDRALLVRLGSAPSEQRFAILAPWVSGVIANALGLDGSGIDWKHGFFDLGMDSITAVEVRSYLQHQIGIEIPATVIFNMPNVSALTAYLLQALALPNDDADEGDINKIADQLERILS